MQAGPLWHVLVKDWMAIENTPPAARRPLEVQRWHFRVDRLAAMTERPAGELVVELKEAARELASRERLAMELALAEDLAVSRAQGLPVKPPWRKKLRVLAEISGQSRDDVQQRIIAAADSIVVVEVH